MPRNYIATDWASYTSAYGSGSRATSNTQAESYIEELKNNVRQVLYKQLYEEMKQAQTTPRQDAWPEKVAKLEADKLQLMHDIDTRDKIILELKETIATLEEELGWSLNKATVPLD